ncbi:hypothetical protein PanWU01x14_026540 [Parasponia andersonii]|uniref:Uncharacterized protein n=1 Tax=Parasponia andersonii TaxID=3476 RepID=A0A2P5DW18_PARAD|nr:hypothetical protein PanWU01x14_026540 [Parasponia andersonii]
MIMITIFIMMFSTGKHQPLQFGERVTEMAPVAVRAAVSSQNHPADFGLVARVSDHGSELRHAMGELAVVPVRTRPSLLPFIAQLRLEHPLVENLQLHSTLHVLFLYLLLHPTTAATTTISTTTPAHPRHIHPLLHPRCTQTHPNYSI